MELTHTEKDDLVEPDFTTADMLEVFASGGNGSEYVDAFWLLNKAAKELREAATRITELQRELAEARETALEEAAKAVEERLRFRSCTCCGPAVDAIRDLRRAARALYGKGET